jgi:hypothetical protein
VDFFRLTSMVICGSFFTKSDVYMTPEGFEAMVVVSKRNDVPPPHSGIVAMSINPSLLNQWERTEKALSEQACRNKSDPVFRINP